MQTIKLYKTKSLKTLLGRTANIPAPTAAAAFEITNREVDQNQIKLKNAEKKSPNNRQDKLKNE